MLISIFSKDMYTYYKGKYIMAELKSLCRVATLAAKIYSTFIGNAKK